MKKANKILSVFLAILMVFSVVPITASAATYSGPCGENLTWSYDTSTCVLTISGTGDMANYKYNNRPWETYEDKIKTVVINDGVTNIGNYAFYSCGALASITIPDSVTKINTFAFFGCKSLTELPVGKNVASIGTNAFQSCTGLVSVTLPDNLTVVASSLFQGCTSITDVTIGKNATSINNSAFQGCTSLTEITLPDSVTNIASLAFADCEKLANVNMGKNVTLIDSSVFSNCKSLKSFVIPEKVTTISSGLFQGCTNLEEVTIPNAVTTIGSSAFQDCSSLKSITIPVGVTKIDNLAFYDCTALTDVHYSGSEYQWNKITIGDNNPSLDTATKHFGVSSIVSGLCGKYVQWSYNLVSGVLTISGTGEMYNYSSNNAPWQEYKSEITTLVIEDGVTSIGANAFYSCENLSTVTFPDSLTTIGDNVFEKCMGLTSITIPDTITTIGEGAFENCENLTSAIIGDGVTTIGKSAFGSCDALESVTLGDKVTTIGERAFEYCEKLKSITIPNSVSTIDKYAFNNCALLTEVIIGSGVTTIGESAFMNCSSLTNVSIPAGVTVINSRTFYYCTNLTYIQIPDTVTKITGDAFYQCKKLMDIYYVGTEEQWNSITIVDSNYYLNDVRIHYNSDHIHVYEATVTAPTCTDKGYTTYTCFCDYFYVDDYVSATGHGSVSSVLTPPTCTEKGYTTHTCHCGVIYVGDYVSATGHGSVSSVVTPPTCTEDGYTTHTCHCGEVYVSDYVDAGHNPISTVVISEASCTTDGEYEHTCGRCGETYTEKIIAQGHNEVVLPAVAPTISSSGLTEGSKCSVCGEVFVEQKFIPALYHCGDNVTCSYNTSSRTLTIKGTGPMYDFNSIDRPWEEFDDEIRVVIIEDGVTSIGNYAFYWCRQATTITVPDSVQSIGDYAFRDCRKLQSINIPYGVTEIGSHAFLFCESLTEVTIPNSVTLIGEDAFGGCYGLTEIVIPDSVITIGKEAFSYCDGLTSVTIGNGVTTIGEDAFYACDGLTTITIPKNVTTIGNCVFADCEKLVSIIVDKDNQHFTNDEFGVLFNKEKTILLQYPMANTRTKYAIPSGVTTIGETAFYNCTALTSIILPDGVKTIDEYAFYGCDGLTSIIIPDGVTTIGDSAFSGCDGITSLVIPDGVTTIGAWAFSSDNLESITLPDSITTIGRSSYNDFTIIIYYGGTANQWKQLLANNPEAESYYLKDNTVYCTDTTVLPTGQCGDNLTWSYNNYTGILTISGIGDMYHFDYFSKFDRAENPWWTFTFDIKKIVIGDGVTRIGGYAFYRCDNLETVYFKGTQQQWNRILIGSDNQPLFNAAIHYNSTETHQPDYTLVVTAPTCTEQGYTTYFCSCGGHCVDNYVYKSGHTDNDNNEYCEICNEYIYIATGTCGANLTWGFNESTDTLIISGTGSMYDYYNNTPWESYQYKIKKVIINDGVTKIGDYAFTDCTNLTSVTIPYSVNWVYFNAFGYCSNLTDVYYCGTEEQWKSIPILSLNEPLLNATIHYNYGKFTGIKDNHFYKNDVMQKAYQLVEFNGDFYFISDYHRIAKNKKVYLTTEQIKGSTYADGTPIQAGYYTFDEEGKMVFMNGPIGEYFYNNNVRVKAYQLVEFEGNFYYVGDYHKLAKNKKIYLTADQVEGLTFADGTPIKVGYYNFDENGKMIIVNGPVGDYFYKNNVRVNAYQLVEFEGNFYFISDCHKIAKNKTVYLTTEQIKGLTYADGTPIQAGYYTFDEEGKMVFMNGPVGDYFYKNNERVKAYQLVEFEGNFYYVSDYHKLAKDKRIYLTADQVNGFTHADGTSLKVGYYNVDADGKLIIE